MNEFWGKVYTKYEYDPDKDLYDQIWDIIEEKMKWYAELFPNKPFYQEDVWKDWSLNMRFSRITTINFPYADIETTIRNCKTDSEKHLLFDKIIWLIPYFVHRYPLRENISDDKDPFIPSPQKLVQYKCPPNIEIVDDTWNDYDVFEVIGRSPESSNINLYINNKLHTCNVLHKKFEYIVTDKVSRINNLYNDSDIVKIGVKCSANTIRKCEGMFRNSYKLIECDLSDINLNYCDSFENMFRNCANLKYLNLSGLDLNISDPDTTNMFLGCRSLKNIIVNNCSNSTIIQLKCVLDKCGIDNVKFIQD